MSESQFLFLCICGAVIVAHAVSSQIERAMPFLIALATVLASRHRKPTSEGER